ncbi:MAG: hypothetical protein QX191_07880, partial [Methylococcaceae bacterium]
VDETQHYEEIILADLDLMRKDWDLAPVSLADVMDDHDLVESEDVVMSIDYDPMTSGTTSFDNTAITSITTKDVDSDEKYADELDQTNYAVDLNTLDQAVVEPINIDISTTDSSTPINFSSIETSSNEPSPIAIEKPLFDDLSERITKEPSLAAEQTSTSIMAVITNYEHKVNRARLISYAALGLSLSALVAVVFVSVLVFNVKTSNAKLTDLVSILQEDIKNLTAKYEGLENNKGVSIDSIIQPPIEKTIDTIKPVTVPTKNKIIHTTVKSTPLKKVDLQSHPIKHSSMTLDGNKKNKPH